MAKPCHLYLYFWRQHSTDVRSPYTRNAELTQSSLSVFLFYDLDRLFPASDMGSLSIRLSFYIDNLRKMSDAHSSCHKICKAHTVYLFVCISIVNVYLFGNTRSCFHGVGESKKYKFGAFHISYCMISRMYKKDYWGIDWRTCCAPTWWCSFLQITTFDHYFSF